MSNRSQNHTDVAVVGAGFAGIAAGRALQSAGVGVRVLERADRPGGRARTETETLGVPFDRGCAWLHQGSLNPLRSLADHYGIQYAQKMPTRFAIDGVMVDERMRDALQAYLDETFSTVAEAGFNGIDRPAADYMDYRHPWYPIARYLMTTINAVEPEQYSTAEAGAETDLQEDWIVYPGLGRLAELAAEGLPIRYRCTVDSVRHGGDTIALGTHQGTLRARAVIVTVSTGVLSTGGIRFEPALPASKTHALDGLPMGDAEKIALRLTDDALPTPENTYLSLLDRDGAFGFHLRPFGQPLAVAYTGGTLAREIAEGPEPAAVDFARHRLAAALGTDVAARVRGGTRTRWRLCAGTAGSYSAARPGCHNLRAKLATPVGQRLFFAGEATDSASFATAHGAWQSGQRAAGEVLAMLSGRD